jgi:hypothetical protein
VTGSNRYDVQKFELFERSIRATLREHYKKDVKGSTEFIGALASALDAVANSPQMGHTRQEPWPGAILKKHPELQRFDLRKYTFDMPRLRGAAECGRLIYLVDHSKQVIRPVMVYTHKQYAGRPPDASLEQLIQQIALADPPSPLLRDPGPTSD